MPEFWTKEQAEANADLNAKEFGNRQILLQGVGAPSMQAPVGSEYEDTSSQPPTRYRKTGTAITDWSLVRIIEPASQQEVENGVNQEKMVTPATLTGKLADFALTVLDVPQAEATTNTGLLEVQASVPDNGTMFDISIPENVWDSLLSVVVFGYGFNASIGNLIGGSIGQIVNIRRGESAPISINSSVNLKLSESMQLDDANQLDNLTLQRISDAVWVELARKEFT